jgi:uncharacterized protein (DUF1919 family)
MTKPEGRLTIISNNCIGGFLYQKYGIKYYSPTVGLQFSQEDFVQFCFDLEHYLNRDLEESSDKKQRSFTALGGGDIDFPVGKIDDIVIYFQHFKTFEEAKRKWEIRKKRINYKCLFFIFVAYDNTSIETLKKFESLKIGHKIIITNKKCLECSTSFALNNGKNPWYGYMNIKLFRKKYYEQYNFYKWFTENCDLRR